MMVKAGSTFASSLCFIPEINDLSSAPYQSSLAANSQTSE